MLRLFAAPLAVLVALAAGCSSKDAGSPASSASAPKAVETKSAPAPKAPGTTFETGADQVVFSIGGEPETLDVGKMRGVNESFVGLNLFEGLVEYPLGEGEVAPGVAERWEVSEDGLTYTFHLRKNAKWSNGDPVTAEDFRWSWLRVLDPATASPYAEMLWIIEGARAFNEGQSNDPSTVGVEVVDPHTLRVKLDYVAPYFLELCAFHTYRPVHRKTVEAHGDEWTRPGKMVSNGPYKLVEWVPNKHVKLVKNDQYWDAANVKIARVTVLPIQDNTTAVNLYESGQLDWTASVNLPAIKVKALSAREDYHEDPYLGVYFYRFNVTHEALKDNKVRRALSLAVDRDAIVRVIKSGHRAAETFVPAMQGYTSGDGDIEFDPEKARKLLAEAGYPGGKGFPSLRILYNTDENHKRVAEMVQQMWSRHLKIPVELVNQEWKVYLKSLDELAYDVSRSGWIGDYHDPMTFLDMWTTGNGNNNTGWSDKEYDGLIEKAKHEPDRQKRLELLTRAETILLQRGPVMPIWHYARAYLLNPAVKGFEPHLLDLHPVKYMHK